VGGPARSQAELLNLERRWVPVKRLSAKRQHPGGNPMHGLIYLIGLIVVIMFILSFLGLR
jgi:hypothetical protein